MQVDVPAAYDKIEKVFQAYITKTRLESLAALKLDIARLDAAKREYELTAKGK